MAQIGLLPTHTLHERIITAIAPWRTSYTKPPFSYEQLVAMALLLHNAPMTHKQIFIWVSKSFPWYASQVAEAFWEQKWDTYWTSGSRRGLFDVVTNIQQELQLVLQSYEFPSYKSVFEDHRHHWSIRTFEGLELLRPILSADQGQKPKKLNFFRLPAELRNVIYDMVFQYPTEAGLVFPLSARDTPIRFDIGLQESEKRNGHFVRKKAAINTRQIGKILDPLLTCRQFYKEAMPSFYRINNFCFEDLECLHRWLKVLARHMRQHISHISFAYPRRDRVVTEMAFKFLLKFVRLRVINLRIEETSWLKYVRTRAEREASREGKDPQQAKQRIRSALDMPGMDTLRSIRGLEEVNVSGIRKDTVQKITIDTLRAEMTKPKKVKPSTQSKKRKTASDSTIEISSECDRTMKRLKAAHKFAQDARARPG